jgi:hypothetical protein
MPSEELYNLYTLPNIIRDFKMKEEKSGTRMRKNNA